MSERVARNIEFQGILPCSEEAGRRNGSGKWRLQKKEFWRQIGE